MVKKGKNAVTIFLTILTSVLFMVLVVSTVISTIVTNEEREIEKNKQLRTTQWLEIEAKFQKEKSLLIKTKDNLLEAFTVDEVELGQAVIDKIITPNMNDYQRVKAIYDYIMRTVAYDYEAYLKEQYAGPEHQQPIGALRDGTAVCGGYAHTMELLCVLADIECIYVYGWSGSAEFGDSEENRHAWNKVKIDDAWYNVDVTWDDDVNGGTYNYFLVSDNRFYINHEVEPGLNRFIPESPKGY